MAKLQTEALHALLLIVILGWFGWRLGKNAWTMYHLRPQIEKATAERNNTLVFRSADGIDVTGKRIPITLKAQRTIVFLLHSSSLQEDLKFWDEVGSFHPQSSALRLVGYCDGDACAEDVRHYLKPPNFPVIEYGDIIGSEAVINADVGGKSILQNGEAGETRYIGWRSSGSTPSNVLAEAMR